MASLPLPGDFPLGAGGLKGWRADTRLPGAVGFFPYCCRIPSQDVSNAKSMVSFALISYALDVLKVFLIRVSTSLFLRVFQIAGISGLFQFV